MKNYWQGGVCLAFADEMNITYDKVPPSSAFVCKGKPPNLAPKLFDYLAEGLSNASFTGVNFIDSNVGNKSSSERVLKDKGYDGTTSDIWSCGVIRFVLMAGYLPFDEPSLIGLYKKIWEASFSCPSWFSSGARNLIKRILNPNPLIRITILEILQDEWFKKGYKPPKLEQDEDAWKLWSKGEAMELIDQLIVPSCVASEVLKCIHIGLLCVQEDPADRPTMLSVVFMLASDDTITLPHPSEPAFSVGRVIPKPAKLILNDGVFSINEVTLSNIFATLI
ncbi:hypothetical protein PVK06_033151 [Gossypium arboreum]|uniref:Protein kinase domain-containing protein n=1 Tax=Gossypium arboreum TaxID=29729 RepID=A0ABR0NAN5_GOSAR|nr:hypothetical protein PVK06_033151 [Gossypium arboreum]